jgi:hypothetical protein
VGFFGSLLDNHDFLPRRKIPTGRSVSSIAHPNCFVNPTGRYVFSLLIGTDVTTGSDLWHCPM